MGILDSIFAGQGTGILNFGSQINPGDFYNPQDEAEQAREAAALRMRLGVKGRGDPTVPFTQMQPGQELYSPGGYQGGDMSSLAAMLGQQQQPMMQPQAPVPGLPQQTPMQGAQQPQPQQQGPSGYLNDGPVKYPVFGNVDPQQQPTQSAPTDLSSQNRMPTQSPQAMPQDNGPGFLEKLVAAMNPALGAQNTAKRNQAHMARALYGALQERGMSPQQAFAVAQAAATDPKMAETLLPQALGLKPLATVEGVIADRMYRGGKGSQGQQSGDPYAEIKKLKAAEAEGTNAGKVVGETQAAAEMNLPGAVAQAKEGLRLIGELRAHKGREGNAWWHTKAGAYLPDSSIPGNTDARDAIGILGQIKGGAFLEAFKALKGGGAITEVEGKKATDAITRMDRSQSKAEFDRALSDYEGIIKLGIDRANQQAGRAAPNQFKGNSDWQQVQPGVRIRQVQ